MNYLIVLIFVLLPIHFAHALDIRSPNQLSSGRYEVKGKFKLSDQGVDFMTFHPGTSSTFTLRVLGMPLEKSLQLDGVLVTLLVDIEKPATADSVPSLRFIKYLGRGTSADQRMDREIFKLVKTKP